MFQLPSWLRSLPHKTYRAGRKSRQRPRAVACVLAKPRLEELEEIVLLSTFTVINTADGGAGSLRQAILDANASAGADTIDFNIAGPGVQTIAPTAALPGIADPVSIDATT